MVVIYEEDILSSTSAVYSSLGSQDQINNFIQKLIEVSKACEGEYESNDDWSREMVVSALARDALPLASPLSRTQLEEIFNKEEFSEANSLRKLRYAVLYEASNRKQKWLMRYLNRLDLARMSLIGALWISSLSTFLYAASIEDGVETDIPGCTLKGLAYGASAVELLGPMAYAAYEVSQKLKHQLI